MNIKQLEYLVKVMECGSITQAAQQMGVSQPGLTKAISNLEEEYGIQILNRRPHGVEFTEQGRDFVIYAKGVIAAAESFPKAGSVRPDKARLFIAAQQLDFLYPLIIETYEKYCGGNVYFNIVETDRSSVVEQILKGNADIGIAVRTSLDISSLVWNLEANRLDIKVVDTSQPYIALSSNSPLWNKESLKLEDVNHFMQVALDMEEQAKQSYWLDRCQYNNLNNNHIVFVNTAGACESLLLATDAITFCSKWTRGCFKSPDIRTIPLVHSGITQELIMIVRKGEALTEAEGGFAASFYRRMGKKIPDEIVINEKWYQNNKPEI